MALGTHTSATVADVMIVGRSMPLGVSRGVSLTATDPERTTASNTPGIGSGSGPRRWLRPIARRSWRAIVQVMQFAKAFLFLGHVSEQALIALGRSKRTTTTTRSRLRCAGSAAVITRCTTSLSANSGAA